MYTTYTNKTIKYRQLQIKKRATDGTQTISQQLLIGHKWSRGSRFLTAHQHN